MSDKTEIAELPFEPNMQLFARSPQEMEAAQHALVVWCTRKIESLFEDLREADENYRIAKQQKWKTAAWSTRRGKVKKQVSYYQKVRSAVKAGYYMVPSFPTELIAVRTEARRYGGLAVSPDYQTSFERQASNRALDEGRGEYASPRVKYKLTRRYKDLGDGGSAKKEWLPRPLEDFDFPFKLVKPQTLSATVQAMALKVFDQIGVMRPQAQGADPIVIGHIFRPRGGMLSFFVAWWLDTKDI